MLLNKLSDHVFNVLPWVLADEYPPNTNEKMVTVCHKKGNIKKYLFFQ